MFSEPVIYLDIETSGGNFMSSRITEIGAIRVENEKIVDEFKSLVNPGHPLPYWITKLTGITDNDLVHAPYFEDIAYQLNTFLDGAVFIAHNVRFDYSYIKRELAAAGYSYSPKLLCTVRLSRAIYPEHKGHSLEKIINRHAISVSARHRAYDDALAIKDFTELAYAEKGADVFLSAVAKQIKTPTLPPHLGQDALSGITNTPGVYIFEDEHGQPLYVGKSVNLRNRVLSHFRQDIHESKEMKLSTTLHSVRVIETPNELQALLLESSLVKELQPLHNRQLRRIKSHFVLVKQTDASGYITIGIADMDLASCNDLNSIYGMYATRSKAKASLENSLRTFQLCPKLLGLEKTTSACFLYQLGKCRGACIGSELPETYNTRLQLALERTKIEKWPFKTAVSLAEADGNGIVIYNWMILGYLSPLKDGEPGYQPIERRFDIDTYRILRGFLKNNLARLTVKPYSAVTVS
jgi:DNA polymerase-3 subunit epsilon